MNALKGYIRYAVITTGTTIKKIKPFKSRPYIEYSFTVNHKIYKSSIGYFYEGEYIPEIKVPNGRYRVIYNRNDPEESVMDFRAPQEEHSN